MILDIVLLSAERSSRSSLHDESIGAVGLDSFAWLGERAEILRSLLISLPYRTLLSYKIGPPEQSIISPNYACMPAGKNPAMPACKKRSVLEGSGWGAQEISCLGRITVMCRS